MKVELADKQIKEIEKALDNYFFNWIDEIIDDSAVFQEAIKKVIEEHADEMVQASIKRLKKGQTAEAKASRKRLDKVIANAVRAHLEQ